MSTNSQEQEIDLSQVFSKIGSFFQSIVNKFFDLIFFIQKKIIILAILFVAGVVIAFLLDGKKNYEHDLTLIPNFGSNEYLYKKVEEFETKLREDDEAFFTKIGIKNYEDIKKIEIEAIPTIYSFVNARNQENNFELIKLMAEDGNLDKILSDEMTSKNYYQHKVKIITKGMWKKEDLVDPLLNSFNNSSYFLQQQQIQLKNLEEKIVLNDSLIKQIDNLLTTLSSNSGKGSSVSISENNSIPELIDKKDKLILESQYLKTNKINYDKIIKEQNSVINKRNYVPLFINSKIVFPLGLLILYLIGFSFLKAYKKQKQRISNS